MPGCAECGQPVTVVSDRAGNLACAHAEPPRDGHKAELLPVTVTYRHEGTWTDVHCDELGGLLGTTADPESAKALAWTLLRRLRPPRGVIERHEGQAST